MFQSKVEEYFKFAKSDFLLDYISSYRQLNDFISNPMVIIAKVTLYCNNFQTLIDRIDRTCAKDQIMTLLEIWEILTSMHISSNKSKWHLSHLLALNHILLKCIVCWLHLIVTYEIVHRLSINYTSLWDAADELFAWFITESTGLIASGAIC